MKKKNFVSLLLTTAGVILLGLGMCMCLVSEWEMFSQGIVVGAIGILILLAMVGVRRKMSGKPLLRVCLRTIGQILWGMAGALILGVGMCFTMLWDRLPLGIGIGIAGILMLISLVPICRGLRAE
ncbi:hypothetical protein [uncultured Ruthenibacterium sp.]|mgnify:CR=1 FL=1|uniref:hypothetical protein n=1 Tax=uncultured Ruthenibacterium sp. TaxID=1905347 RepID=UPI00349EDCD1